MTAKPSRPELAAEVEDLRARLAEAEEVLRAIRNGEVDAVVVTGERGEQVYTLHGAYRQLTETMSEGVVTLSADGVVLYCNVRLAEMLGRPLDQVLGTALRNYLTPADQPALDAVLAQTDPEPSRREINLKTSEGSLVPVFLSASRLSSDEAKAVFCLVFTDLTEQKSLQRITAEQRLSRLVLEQATEAIVVCDEQGRVIRASQAAQQFCDGSPLLRPFAEAFPLRTDASDPFHLAPVLQGETLRNVDVALDRQGQKLDLLLSAGPLLSGRQILGCVVTLTDITERKRADEARRASEAEFRTLAEAMPQMVWITRPDGWNIYFSQQWMDYTGLTLEESLGHGWNKPFHPEDQQRAWDAWQHATATIDTYSLECRLRRADGIYRWWLIRGVPLQDAAGNILKWFGTCTDIHTLKQAEETLRESEEKYRTLVENAAEAIVIAQDGLLKFVNRMASEITGYSEQELLSLPFLDFVHQDDRAMVGEHYVRRLKGEVPVLKYAFRLINKDGSFEWVEINAVLVTWDGKPATLNFLSDITERMQAEEALKESENKYRLLAENAQDVIFVLDMNLKYTYVSPSVKILRGYEPEEVLKQQFFEILTPSSRDLAMRTFSEVMEMEKSGPTDIPISRTLQLEIRRKDGSTVWTEVKFSFIRDENQRPVGILGVTRDITERKGEIERVRKALGATVQAIAMTVETRDPYTAGHQRRVADLARAMAMEMNLSADQIDGIRMAAAIHDLGKISVPAEILSKPTKLTDLEFRIIKTHSQCGYDILKDIDFPWPVGRMVLEHHERINGSGYPNGLTGDQILMESRILSVADVVEAMASHRPYRPALGIEAALAEIEKNKGLLYDPDVVSACLTLFRKQGFRFTENPGL